MRTILPLLTMLVALSGSGVRAELPANAQATVDAAFKDVEASVRRSREKGTMPKWSDPDDQPVLARMWDAAAILGAPPYTAKDVPVLLAITPKEGALLKSYVLFAAKAGTPPDFAANARDYEDEIARASAFMIRINSAELPAVTDFMTHLKPEQLTDVRLQRLRQMRLGMLQEVTGATMIVRSSDLKAANKAIIVVALADGADALAAASSPADREAMIKTVEPTMPLLTDAEKSRMEGFIKAMRRTDCIGLCALN